MVVENSTVHSRQAQHLTPMFVCLPEILAGGPGGGWSVNKIPSILITAAASGKHDGKGWKVSYRNAEVHNLLNQLDSLVEVECRFSGVDSDDGKGV
ncbi:hypothetical protein ZHAS_00015493 [Anopheles sinensis]|uniref:Uncharacterized protein n=1 Tax=Anopheles sinensis TaxID=74873 RepID=A0A084WAV0_ANOSI|nr:hypothetical protein ZHAS_00015493 [Anopheles sinensis]